MNHASYANVGAGIPGPAPPTTHGQMTAMNKLEHNQQNLLRRVALSLQTQGLFTGWRAEVSIAERTMKVVQMYAFPPSFSKRFSPESSLLCGILEKKIISWC
jgi:hypothetical protein